MDAETFINNQKMQVERRLFAVPLLLTIVAYAGITFWLNSIRENAAIWIVWVLIAIQILLYIGIFTQNYKRAKAIGLNSSVALIIFIILAIGGRVNNWELIIIPVMTLIMLILSARYSGKPTHQMWQDNQPTS